MQNSTTYRVRGTSAAHRENIENDYIIVMNSHVKSLHRINQYAVVQKLFINNRQSDTEWRNMVAFGKVVIDEQLSDDEVAIDQTLRNALGMEFNKISGNTVKLYALERTFTQKLRAVLRPGQFLYLRVNYPALNDMEKKLCRISPNSTKLLNSNDGNSVWVECCRSDYRREVNWLFNEIIYEKNIDSYKKSQSILERYFSDLELLDELYIRHPQLDGLKNLDYIKALAELMLSPDLISGKDPKLFALCKRTMHNIAAYGEWMDEEDYKLVDEKITAYEYNHESEEQIHDFQKNNAACTSLEEKYPDSDLIFNMQPDLETIRLDKYYRDKLSLNILDSVKVKRRWLESLRDDIIEYGLVFVLTIFAAVAAVTPENRHMLSIAVPISIVFTIIIMYIRNK